ncbi:hypothetical protein THRCLA_02214 [Thraustotheca clavata]|uniref:Uncharacterized protein n=1 Tax=Thraustotheca clavata TaxID=74557 RepID=A0A1W0A5W8_9STRA|nr:hypothetical protein THRCLA_02214 [Thraustotheca clavata]
MASPLLPLTKSPRDGASPRKHKMKTSGVRGSEFTMNDTGTDRVGLGNMHDMLLFDQKLRDASNEKGEIEKWSRDENVLTSNKLTFEILTSDRGQRVVTALIDQWQMDKFSDNGHQLWSILETFFGSLPLVVTHESQMRTKLMVRYISAMTQLKDALVGALFCPNAAAAAAFTSSLVPAHREKIPLYYYCHQLEREVQLLKNITTDQPWEMIPASDVGLLQDTTARQILEYWKLPKRERLAFVAQILTHSSDVEGDLVRLLLDNNTFILRRIVEELGYESKEERHNRHMQNISQLVTKSVTASLEAKKLRQQNEAKRKELEPIQLRNKGIQVTMGEDLPPVVAPPHTPKGSMYSPRRFTATRDKNMKLALMQDYQPFTKKEKTHVLVKDIWTASSFTDNLIHHLALFVDNANDKHLVPLNVLNMATLLLEWLRFEKARATAATIDEGFDLMNNTHFKQSMISMMQVLINHSGESDPHNVVNCAQAIQDFLVNKRQNANLTNTTPIQPQEVPLHLQVNELHPTDVRNFLKAGFPPEIASHLVTIATDTNIMEKQSHLILLMDLLERHTKETMHKQQHSTLPVGFGDTSAESNALSTMLDLIKELILNTTDENREELGDKVATMILQYTHRQSTIASSHVRTLKADGVCHVLLTKLEHEMQTGPLDQSTRKQLTQLNSLVSTFVYPEKEDEAFKLSPEHIKHSISWLGALMNQVMLQKQSLDNTTSTSLLNKTQVKMNGASLTACLSTLVNALQISGDKKLLEEFVTSLDELHEELKKLLNLSANSTAGIDEDPWELAEAAIDAIVADKHVDAIPRCIIQLTEKLKDLQKVKEAAVAKQSKVRTKAAKSGTVVFGNNLLWEKDTKGRKTNILGISVTELSDMFPENKTIMNLSTVLKLVYQIYRERYEFNLSDQDSVSSTAFIDFVYDWYLRKYYMVVESCDGLLNIWTNGTFLASSTKLQISSLIQTLEDSYDKRFGPFISIDIIKEKLSSRASSDDPSTIDQDVATEVAIEEFVAIKLVVESMLRDIYDAGESHDEMGYDEFATVVHHISPCITERETVKMFKEAISDQDSETIPQRRFVSTIIDHGVLSTRLNKFKTTSAVAPTSAAFPEYEEEQFVALEETWKTMEDEIFLAIDRIPHKEVASSILLRVRILKMIIIKRIDSETAWISHRMILRDINRFKDLNEVAITAIKSKEARFKEAVGKLTSTKFGVFRDLPASNSSESSAMAFVKNMDENNLSQQLHTAYKDHNLPEESDAGAADQVSRLEDKLRDEILHLPDEGCSEGSLEETLDSYSDAVKKVRRANDNFARILRRVTIALKAAAVATQRNIAQLATIQDTI